MIKDRTYKLAASAWLALAVFISAGLVQAVVSDDINASVDLPGPVSLGSDVASEAAAGAVAIDTSNFTETAAQTENDTAANETGPAIDAVAATSVEVANETEVEAATAPEADNATEEGVGGRVHAVCLNGCEYTTIQAAIAASEDGDLVEVGSGTYNENVIVDRRIALRGVNTGEGVPVVNAQGNGSAVVLRASGVVLEGLQIANAGLYPSAGVEVVSNDNLIAGCSILDSGWWGIYLKGGSTNNTVRDCVTSNSGNDGIMLYKAPGNTLKENTVGDSGDNGIQILESDRNVLERNVVGNSTNSGVFLEKSGNAIVMGNIIIYNGVGIRLLGSESGRIGPNLLLNNTRDLESA